jgi:hypothetical protein
MYPENTQSNTSLMAQLSARVEQELRNDHELVMQNVMTHEIASALEETYGIKPVVSIEESRKLFGFRFVKAYALIGVPSMVIKARRNREGELMLKKVTINGQEVRNARELSAAIDEALTAALDEYV